MKSDSYAKMVWIIEANVFDPKSFGYVHIPVQIVTAPDLVESILNLWQASHPEVSWQVRSDVMSTLLQKSVAAPKDEKGAFGGFPVDSKEYKW